MHSVTGKLNKAAKVFQAGEYTGFGVHIGVKFYNKKAGQDEWTNYKAVIFSKNPNQINFYQECLVAGSVITINSANLRIDSFDGQNGVVVMIEMLNASLGFIHTPLAAHATTQGQQSYRDRPLGAEEVPAQTQPQGQSSGGGFSGFDDDIDF